MGHVVHLFSQHTHALTSDLGENGVKTLVCACMCDVGTITVRVRWDLSHKTFEAWLLKSPRNLVNLPRIYKYSRAAGHLTF
jgi:hypothetical protein